MDNNTTELYYKLGLMPDWIYYQLNGKTAEENFIDIMNKRSLEYMNTSLKSIELDIEKQLYNSIDKALDDILKKFNT